MGSDMVDILRSDEYLHGFGIMPKIPRYEENTYPEERSTWMVLPRIYDRVGQYLNGSMTGNQHRNVSPAKEISMVRSFEPSPIGFYVTDLVGNSKCPCC